jgi:hypothetical protein
MDSTRIRKDIASAITSYQTQFVELERIVDVAGYQPTLEGLNDASNGAELSQFWVTLDLDSQDDQSGTRTFVDSLSIKSKGLLLTSALMTDNDRLYAPLCTSVMKEVGGLYSQDLYSMMSGEFAHSALSEMTSRAARNLKELATFNSSLQSISATVNPLGSLAQVKNDIVSSQWVDQHPEASQKFLTLVDAAPATIEVSELRANPLKKYLAKGLKLAAAATVLGAVALGSLWGANFMQHSENVGYVDLSTRPTIETSIGSGKFEQRKIVNYGEFDGAKLAKHYGSAQINKTLGESIAALTEEDRSGFALLYEKGEMSDDHATCLVSHKQLAPSSTDGNFYIFHDKDPAITDKKYVDFMVKSHETGHCFFFVDIGGDTLSHPTTSRGSYNKSLNEVAADLTAIVDYMRLNGNADIYHDYIRPRRLVNVHDNWHRTAWALDVILTQIDAASMQQKTAQEVPEVVRFLMEKNFMAKDGTYNPGVLSQRGTTGLEQPAAKALWNDVFISMTYTFDRDTALKERLKTDIVETFSSHVARYEGVAPPDVIQAAKDGYARLSEKYDLAPLKEVSVPQAKLAKPMESMMNAFL